MKFIYKSLFDITFDSQNILEKRKEIDDQKYSTYSELNSYSFVRWDNLDGLKLKKTAQKQNLFKHANQYPMIYLNA